MAIDLATGFNIGSKDVIDERQVLTLEQMKNLDETIYPDKYFAICKDNGKLYIFNASNEINDETGKFRLLSGGTGGGDTTYVLPPATDTTLGGVKVDNITITVDSEGIITAINSYTKTEVDDLLNNKLDKPTVDGTAGQILVLQDDGSLAYADIPGSGNVDDIQEEIDKKLDKPAVDGTAGQILVLQDDGSLAYEDNVGSDTTDLTNVRKAFCDLNELNNAKGTNISLVVGEDNTEKIMNVLEPNEEFINWFNNENTYNRFGIDLSMGNRLNSISIQKYHDNNGIVIAITNKGKVLSRYMRNNILSGWDYDTTDLTGINDKLAQLESKANHKSIASLTLNSKTFKIDISKVSQGLNGNIKFGYCVDNGYGEIIIYSLGANSVRWNHSTGVRYVNSVTYTIDPDDNTHITIGVEFYDVIYGVHQIETPSNFATINSFTGESYTGTSVATRGGIRGRNNGVGIVGGLEDLGLTTPCTTVQIAQAMRNLTVNTTGIPLNYMTGLFDNASNSITDAPSLYGLLQVNSYGHDRLMIRYDGISVSSFAGSWIGRIKGKDGIFSEITWTRIDNGNSTELTNINTKLTQLETKANLIPVVGDNPTDYDLNNYIENGNYSIGDSSKYNNVPESCPGLLTVIRSNSYRLQLYTCVTNNNVYFRKSTNWGSAWSSWVLLNNSSGTSGNGTNNDVYSTEEQAVGTWINGKTLYRRSMEDYSVSVGTGSRFIPLIRNFSGVRIVKVEGAVEIKYDNGNSTIYQLPAIIERDEEVVGYEYANVSISANNNLILKWHTDTSQVTGYSVSVYYYKV